jgi:hypothetical protein
VDFLKFLRVSLQCDRRVSMGEFDNILEEIFYGLNDKILAKANYYFFNLNIFWPLKE